MINPPTLILTKKECQDNHFYFIRFIKFKILKLISPKAWRIVRPALGILATRMRLGQISFWFYQNWMNFQKRFQTRLQTWRFLIEKIENPNNRS